MKIKTILVSFTIAVSLNATTITELFSAIEKQPSIQIDKLNKKMGKMGVQKINSSYYPTLDIFANYTHYNTPSSMVPLDPISAGKLTKANEPLPFAQTIQKVGVTFSMPLFIKELSDLSEKMKHLAKSAKYKKELNLYKAQAVIVGANSALEYLDNLLKALNSTKKSVQNTRDDIEISVQSGRMAGIALDKIDQKLNELEIKISSIKIKRLDLISTIEKLTQIHLKNSVNMALNKDIKKGDIFILKPLQEVLKANLKDLQATKSKRYYPKVALNVMYSKSYTQDDVSQGKSINEGYGYYQIGVSLPLYNKSDDTDIELKKIALMKSRKKIEQTKIELQSDVNTLQNQLKLLDKSKKLTMINIQKQKNLLSFAKVAIKEGRMTEEDYLKYEDGLLNAKAAYYQVVSQKWQNIAKLAVIYGNNLKGVIR